MDNTIQIIYRKKKNGLAITPENVVGSHSRERREPNATCSAQGQQWRFKSALWIPVRSGRARSIRAPVPDLRAHLGDVSESFSQSSSVL